MYRLDYYYCGRPYTQSTCPEKLKEAPKLIAGNKGTSGTLTEVSAEKPVGIGIWAGEGVNATKRGGDENWISDSGTTKSITPDVAGFDNYELAPPGRTVEMGDGTRLSMADCGGLRLQVEQDRTDGGPAREPTLRRAAHVPV